MKAKNKDRMHLYLDRSLSARSFFGASWNLTQGHQECPQTSYIYVYESPRGSFCYFMTWPKKSASRSQPSQSVGQDLVVVMSRNYKRTPRCFDTHRDKTFEAFSRDFELKFSQHQWNQVRTDILHMPPPPVLFVGGGDIEKLGIGHKSQLTCIDLCPPQAKKCQFQK